MSDTLLDVRSTRALLRRRNRVVLAATLLGLALGIAFVLAVPPSLTSKALVLLPTPTLDQGESRDVPTQVRIALSARVLTKAGDSLRPRLGEREVERRVNVTAPTDQLLQIESSSRDAAQAKALAQAVAQSYVAFVKEADQQVTSVAGSELATRETDLQAQIEVLQKEIEAALARQRGVSPQSADGRKEAQLLAGLRTDQADLSLRLDKVKSEISTLTPAGSATSAGTSVLQDASPAIGQSTAQRLFLWGPAGAFVGFAACVVVLLGTARRDPRMGLRDEIADAVGSPVIAAVRSHPQRSVAGWRTLLATYEASAVESWAFRQLLRTLAATEAKRTDVAADGRHAVDHPTSVLIVSLAGDARGLALGPQFAAFAASMGIRTRIVTATGHDRAAALWAACHAEESHQPRPDLSVGPETETDGPDLTVVLVVLDRRGPQLDGVPATSCTVLCVAAAGATEQELARAAVAVDDAGRRIDGVVVADPDRADRTSGRHTLDERAGRIALPVRLTGVGPVERSGRDPQRRRS